MEIRCENCGNIITVNGLGRKKLNIPVIIVCDAVREHPTVAAAAEKLECSTGYIFKTLKSNNLTLKEVRGW